MKIDDAGMKGKGAFAAKSIATGSVVATFAGRVRWIWDIPEPLWPHAFQVGYDLYVLPRRVSAGWAINHSCTPNCLVAGRSLVTERPIEVGEELTFDYSTDVDWPGYAMDCRCAEKDCRGVVRAYRFLPVKLKRRYGRNVADFIWEEYGRRLGDVATK